MSRPLPTYVERVGIVGTGVIGGGWVAHFLRQGMYVTAWDPESDTEGKLRRRIDALWPTLERIGLEPKPRRTTSRLCRS